MQPAAGVNTIENVQMTFSKLYFYWGRLAEWQLSLNLMDHSCTMESTNTHTHTHTGTEKKITGILILCFTLHRDSPTEKTYARTHFAFVIPDLKCFSSLRPLFQVMVQGAWLSQLVYRFMSMLPVHTPSAWWMVFTHSLDFITYRDFICMCSHCQ